MSITAFRITLPQKRDAAFTGQESKRAGGRWHSPGTCLVYTADSIALAQLELFAHLSPADLRRHYVVRPCRFSPRLVTWIDPARLPPRWYRNPAPALLRQIGDDWAEKKISAVLAVPSAVVRLEFNFILNPQHPRFRQIELGADLPLKFDPRLIKK